MLSHGGLPNKPLGGFCSPLATSAHSSQQTRRYTCQSSFKKKDAMQDIQMEGI